MPFPTILPSLLLAACPSTVPQGDLSGPEAIPWDARHAEHLLNRAAFGGDSRLVARVVERGLEATLESLFEVDPWLAEPFYARKRSNGKQVSPAGKMTPDEKREQAARMRADDSAQLDDFQDWWIARMLSGRQALAERMTLFWHGHFASSFRDVKSSYEVIRQNQTFRHHALGDFGQLLADMARDPALLIYLDNDQNRKGKPNENFAREWFELFTLGEGNYTEEDVREAARAFTGWGARQGQFRIVPKQHDRGRKEILGRHGDFDGQDVVRIVLRRPECALFVAQRLLTYFEGLEPDAARLERYAAEFREDGYRIDHFLGRLFRDPEFYRDEAMAVRIASPIDWLVGSSRRLGLDVPPRAIGLAAALLGEHLFQPPSVKGWDEGVGWVAACPPDWYGWMIDLLLGNLEGEWSRPSAQEAVSMDLEAESMDAMDSMEMEAAMEPEEDPEENPVRARAALKAAYRRLPTELRQLRRLKLHPRLNLTRRLELAQASGDRAVAHGLLEDLLAIPVDAALVDVFAEELRGLRESAGLTEVDFQDRSDLAEPVLRSLAGRILALPEARLH